MPYKCIWVVWGLDIRLLVEKYIQLWKIGKISTEFSLFLQFQTLLLCGRITRVAILAVARYIQQKKLFLK